MIMVAVKIRWSENGEGRNEILNLDVRDGKARDRNKVQIS